MFELRTFPNIDTSWKNETPTKLAETSELWEIFQKQFFKLSQFSLFGIKNK